MTKLARFCQVLIGMPVAVCLLGCGQSSYEQTMVQTEAKLKQAGKFSELSLVSVVIPDTPFQIRLPQPLVSRTAYKVFAAAAAEGDGSGPKAEEIQPPFLKLPDLKVVFQQIGADERERSTRISATWQALPPGATFTAPAPKPAAPEPKAETPAEADNPMPVTENKPKHRPRTKPKAPAEQPARRSAAEPPADKPEEKPAGEAAAAAGTCRNFLGLDQRPSDRSVSCTKSTMGAGRRSHAGANQPPIILATNHDEGVQPFQFLGSGSSDFLEKVDGKFVLYMCKHQTAPPCSSPGGFPRALEPRSPVEQWAVLAAGTLRT